MVDETQTILPEDRDDTPRERPRRVHVRMMEAVDEDDDNRVEAMAEQARMMGLYEESLKDIDEGEIVRGTVLAWMIRKCWWTSASSPRASSRSTSSRTAA